MKNEFMWTYLIHLSRHMWDDETSTPRAYLDPGYTENNNTEVDVWDEVVNHLAEYKINTLLIDVGDAIQYETHPEISAPDAWSKDFLKTKLDEIRALGIEPIPKLNFSTCHDTWLKEYRRMISTSIYYRVCSDLIAEVCEVFGYPRLFHLGLDEENYQLQKRYDIAIIRHEKVWEHDVNFFCHECEKHGARPWIWSDYAYDHLDFFEKKMSRSILQSNWYYGQFLNPGEPNPNPKNQQHIECYELLDRWGFEQVPTCSSWRSLRNIIQTVGFSKDRIDPGRLKGFMVAPWLPTRKGDKHALINDAERLYYARKKWYPETLKDD